MDQLVGLLARIVQQQAQFVSNQLKMQDKVSHRAEAAPTPPSENSFNGSSAFTDFIREHNRPLRRGSLDELTQQVEKKSATAPFTAFHATKISWVEDIKASGPGLVSLCQVHG